MSMKADWQVSCRVSKATECVHDIDSSITEAVRKTSWDLP